MAAGGLPWSVSLHCDFAALIVPQSLCQSGCSSSSMQVGRWIGTEFPPWRMGYSGLELFVCRFLFFFCGRLSCLRYQGGGWWLMRTDNRGGLPPARGALRVGMGTLPAPPWGSSGVLTGFRFYRRGCFILPAHLCLMFSPLALYSHLLCSLKVQIYNINVTNPC